MSKFNYARTAATAQRLIERFGGPGTLTQPPAKSGDAWNPTLGSATSAPCTVAVVDYSARDRTSGLIEMSDQRALVAVVGQAVAPVVGAKLRTRTGGVDYTVVTLTTVRPGGTAVLYDMQVRV